MERTSQILFVLAVLILAIVMAGCVDLLTSSGSPESLVMEQPGANEGELGNGPVPPENMETGESLEYFYIYDETAIRIDQEVKIEVFPGQATTILAGGGCLEVVFGPNSLKSTQSVEIRVENSGGYIEFDFRPDGLTFDPADPVQVHFYPHVPDPDQIQDWTKYDVYFESSLGKYDPMTSVHATKSWTDPKDGSSSSRYSISSTLDHFSRYAVLR